MLCNAMEQEEDMHRRFDTACYASEAQLDAFDSFTANLNAEATSAIAAAVAADKARGAASPSPKRQRGARR